MKKVLQILLGVAAIIMMVPNLGLTTEDQRNFNWSESELLRTGRALSIGTTLTSPFEITSSSKAISQFPKSVQDFGIDPTKFNPEALKTNAVKELGKTTIKNEFRLSGMGAPVAIVGAGEMMIKMWNAWRVGTGRVEPDVLRSTIPHVVQAWDAIKGPKNLPTQTFTTSINHHYDDGALQVNIKGSQTVRQSFSTTAQGKIGNYGFDPYTDKIIRQTTTSTTRHESFDGSRFNSTYRNQSFSTPVYTSPPTLKYNPPATPRYTPPQIPRYTPPPTFNSTPSFRR